MNPRTRAKGFVTAVSLAIALVGCSTMEQSDAIDTERVLAAAGFEIKFADTPAQKEQLAKLAQRKISHLDRNGRLVFVYADSKYCKCMYVGTESEYQRFQKLTLERDIAMDESVAAENASMDWTAWGTW